MERYYEFSQDAASFLIHFPATPRPWMNHLWNKDGYQFSVSQVGNGESTYLTAQNDLTTVTRPWHRYFYLRDDVRNFSWCPAFTPLESPLDEFICEHNLSFTDIRSRKDGIHAALMFFVPMEVTTSAESQASRVPGPAGAGEEAAAAQALLDTALAGRPEIRAAEFRVKASEAGLKSAKAAWYPQVPLAGNYYYLRPNPRYMPALDRLKGTWDVAVAVSFDVWNWGQTKNQAEQAKAQLAQARDVRDLLEDQAVLEVTPCRLVLTQARRKIGLAAAAVDQADENLRLVRERFRQGVALNADVLDAEIFL